MSARSTGSVVVTVTVPVARSTSTDRTPATAEISSVTARWQCAQVMPVTANVVEPVKVRGVSVSMGTPLGCGGSIGTERRRQAGCLTPGKSPGSVAVSMAVSMAVPVAVPVAVHGDAGGRPAAGHGQGGEQEQRGEDPGGR